LDSEPAQGQQKVFAQVRLALGERGRRFQNSLGQFGCALDLPHRT
jgi:hypothetical protein